jgi:ribosome silencing factor RsfS/YbeB/iojap
MDIRKLQRAIVDGLEDVKGQNIVVFNTEHLSPLFERVIIASGTSNRQTKSLAQGVRDSVKSRGMQVLRTEGEENGEWIIVDCGAAVVHLMQPSIRDYYRLEEIWGGKPVKMKIDVAPVRLVKASEPEPAPVVKSSRKAAPRQAAHAGPRGTGHLEVGPGTTGRGEDRSRPKGRGREEGRTRQGSDASCTGRDQVGRDAHRGREECRVEVGAGEAACGQGDRHPVDHRQEAGRQEGTGAQDDLAHVTARWRAAAP